MDQAFGVNLRERARDMPKQPARTIRRKAMAGFFERSMNAIVERGAVRAAVDKFQNQIANRDHVAEAGFRHGDFGSAFVKETHDIRRGRAAIREASKRQGLKPRSFDIGLPLRRRELRRDHFGDDRARRRDHRWLRARLPCRRS